MPTQAGWPVNELGEVVATAGVGSTSVKGVMSEEYITVGADGKVKFAGVSSSPVTITGTLSVGSVLTAALGSGWTATGYQWVRITNGVSANISGQTTSTYALTNSDVGNSTTTISISCTVTGLTFSASNVSIPVVIAPPVAVPLAVNSRIVMEGDSITAGSNGPQYSWYIQALTNAGLFFPVGWNQATGGETAQQMATQTAAITSLLPDVVTLLAGTNDLGGTARTPAQIFADIQTCVNAYISGGAKAVVVSTVLPRNGTNVLTSPREADRVALNTLISGMASDKIKIVNIEASFNPTTDCSDGLHPNWAGARKLGEAFSAALVAISAPNNQSSVYLDAANLCGATAMTGTSGNKSGTLVSGVVADGWTVEENGGMTVVCSKVIDNGVEKQRMLISGTNSANGNIVRLRKSFNANVSTSQLVDEMMEISVSGLSGASSMYIDANTAKTPSQVATGTFTTLLSNALFRPQQTVNASALTSIYLSVVLTFNAGVVGADITVGKPYLKVIPNA